MISNLQQLLILEIFAVIKRSTRRIDEFEGRGTTVTNLNRTSLSFFSAKYSCSIQLRGAYKSIWRTGAGEFGRDIFKGQKITRLFLPTVGQASPAIFEQVLLNCAQWTQWTNPLRWHRCAEHYVGMCQLIMRNHWPTDSPNRVRSLNNRSKTITERCVWMFSNFNCRSCLCLE